VSGKIVPIFIALLLALSFAGCKKRVEGNEEVQGEGALTTPTVAESFSEYVLGTVTGIYHEPTVGVGEELEVKVEGYFSEEGITLERLEVSIKEDKKLVEVSPQGVKPAELTDISGGEAPFESTVSIQFPTAGNWRVSAPGEMGMVIKAVVVTE